MSNIFESIIDKATTSLTHLMVTRYLSLAGLVVLLYDHGLTFADEVRLIWPARTSIVKVLFLFNRYTVPIFLIITSYALNGLHSYPFTNTFCRRWIGASSYLGLTSLGISNFLLLLRVYAIHEGNKKILLILLGAFVASYAVTITFATMGLLQLLPSVEYSLTAKTCVPGFKPKIMAAIWGAPIAFELTTAAFTAFKAYEHGREQLMKSDLLWVLYRDGFIVFTVIVLLRVMNLLIWLFGPVTIVFMGVYPSWSFVTVLIGRMLLNLRGVSTPDEWNDANDAALADALRELPGVLIIGNPNRFVGSGGDVQEWDDYEDLGVDIARSRDDGADFLNSQHTGNERRKSAVSFDKKVLQKELAKEEKEEKRKSKGARKSSWFRSKRKEPSGGNDADDEDDHQRVVNGGGVFEMKEWRKSRKQAPEANEVGHHPHLSPPEINIQPNSPTSSHPFLQHQQQSQEASQAQNIQATQMPASPNTIHSSVTTMVNPPTPPSDPPSPYVQQQQKQRSLLASQRHTPSHSPQRSLRPAGPGQAHQHEGQYASRQFLTVIEHGARIGWFATPPQSADEESEAGSRGRTRRDRRTMVVVGNSTGSGTGSGSGSGSGPGSQLSGSGSQSVGKWDSFMPG